MMVWGFEICIYRQILKELIKKSSLCLTRNRHFILKTADKPSRLTSDEIMACLLVGDTILSYENMS